MIEFEPSRNRDSAMSKNITVKDMYELLSVLREGLTLRGKDVDHQQYQIELNQRQIEHNKKILANVVCCIS